MVGGRSRVDIDEGEVCRSSGSSSREGGIRNWYWRVTRLSKVV